MNAHLRIQRGMRRGEAEVMRMVRRDNRAGYGFTTEWDGPGGRVRVLPARHYAALERLEARGRVRFVRSWSAARGLGRRHGFWAVEGRK